ncbi:hypothetical protein ABZ438_37415 [Streptomyces sp. NPDC005786]|uniref:hypothetical protein n=1 Tax=Streptomyces sp. NPDC005786 TaxID=3154891 RepID=UPI0033CA6FB1
MTALLAGAISIPEFSAPSTAVAADACATSAATYVVEVPAARDVADSPLLSHTLRKYVNWDPKGGGANGPLLDANLTATVPGSTTIIAARGGIFYTIDRNGMKSFQDKTAEGGSLLAPRKTFVANADQKWSEYERIWSSGATLWAIDHSGGYHKFIEGANTTAGLGTMVEMPGTPVPGDALPEELRKAKRIWAVGDNKVYGLNNGEIKEYSFTRFGGMTGGTVIASGLGNVDQAWSPGPGAVFTLGSDSEYSGQVKGYTGTTALNLANPDLLVGVRGQVMTDTATCLADPPVDKPAFGTVPDDSDVSPAPAEPAPDPAPAAPGKVEGRFVLGNGTPAAGLEVIIEPMDVADDVVGSVKPPVLGKAVTASDGTWSFTLPATLPAEVQAVVNNNGGALNVSATAAGTTSAGTPMVGLDHTVAAPADPVSKLSTPFAAAASGEVHTAALMPAGSADVVPSDPTKDQEAATYSATRELNPVASDDLVPAWQSDRSQLPSDFNPYLVNGTDISAQPVFPYSSGTCETLRTYVSNRIAYTTVGEAHAYWDAKATFDYDNKLSSTVDVAVSTSNKWKLSGGASVGSSTGQATGYTNRGPYFAKQYKIPLKYTKYKYTYYCSGTPRGSWQKIIPGKYSIPAGGAVGKIGADVRYKDGGIAFSKSAKSHRAYIEAGTYFQLSRGKSSKWTGAASAYGITLGASTTYDKDHKQRITAGSKSSRHDIWGKNDSLSGKPGLMFSY